MVKSFVSSKELRLTLVFAKVTQFQNWQNDEYTEFCKQRNQVIFLMNLPLSYSLHQALALGLISSGKAEDSQSWGWSF